MTISVLDKDGNPQTLDPPTQTTLAAILAKLSSDPATQTTLAAILAKLIAAPATEAKQDAIVTALGALATAANQSTANTTLATLLTAGTPITGQSLETGGAGALGWFASIRKKIAAFGTAGAPSADVLTVQGVSGGTALPVTLSGTPATLADGMSKPTTSALAAWLFGYNGATGDLVRVQSFRVDLNAISITAIATVWAPTSGKRFRLMGGSISVSAACSVVFEDGAAGAANFVWRTPNLVADTPYNFDLGNGRPSATINTTLKATASVAATITGTLYGVEE